LDRRIETNFGGQSSGRRWWAEWEVVFLLTLVSAIYLPRLAEVTLRGEETRRAQIGIEMVWSGDWVVPRQQEEPFLSRPPLQNWIIVGLGTILGECSEWAVRLPSVAAVFGLVLLIYGYSRQFLSRFASLVAAAGYATMIQVMELGRLGETDMMFAMFVSGSLLTWHWGYARRWPSACVWIAAYVFVAFGTLAKGPQAPMYFSAIVGVFLLASRNWSYVLSWSHALGVAVFLAIWGAWQVPFYFAQDMSGVLAIYGQDVGFRFEDTSWPTIFEHLATYPFEILLGCMLPWSLLFFAYGHRRMRASVGSAKGHVLFLVICILVTFPTVWLVPGAKSRYFLPIYPCFTPLFGLVVDRACNVDASRQMKVLWTRYLVALGLAMPIVGVFVLLSSLSSNSLPVFEGAWPFSGFYAVAGVVLGGLTLWSSRKVDPIRNFAGMFAIVVFMGLSFTGLFTNSIIQRSVDVRGAVAEVKAALPSDTKLVSFGSVFHPFAYYYGRPIPMIDWPGEGKLPDEDVTYFCYHVFSGPYYDKVDFPFEKVAVVSCDRYKSVHPKNVVVVGRRLAGQIKEK